MRQRNRTTASRPAPVRAAGRCRAASIVVSIAATTFWWSAAVLSGGCGEERAPGPASAGPEGRSPALPGAGDRGPAGADGVPWLAVRADAGISFRHVSGARPGRHLMPEIIGGGAALADLDGDGKLDAYLVQSGDLDATPGDAGRNRVYRNRGDGTFEDRTSGSGADDPGYGMGVACGDVDADGRVDIYVTNFGPNALLRNSGGFRFDDVTTASGTGDPEWSTSAGFLDYDRDGHLDLFVCNYIRWTRGSELTCYNLMGTPDYCLPTNYNAPARDTLYRNRGDGTFEDVSAAAGIAARAATGLGVVAADFTGNGLIDLFVANDAMPDHFWLNRGDGRFTDEALLVGVAVNLDGKATASMGVSIGDLHGSGRPDLIVCNIRHESDALFRNTGKGFVDITAASGLGSISRAYTRWGMGLVDFDNDSLLDLYQANGRVMRQDESATEDPYAEVNVLFRGTPGPRFTEVRPRGGTVPPVIGSSRAAAFGDVDDDGGIDILLVERDGPARLLRNAVPDRGNWLLIRVEDRHGRDALGAVVTMEAAGRTVRRDVIAAWSYCASNDPRVHVGLGSETHGRDVTVRWPDGSLEQYGSLSANSVHRVRQGEGRTADPDR
ncbi:MAG: CRTAC1 family protein [Phycisphaeraceae bacterium]|nr:CRTAC1 family protein [Phycisphaeraceae bacterium]